MAKITPHIQVNKSWNADGRVSFSVLIVIGGEVVSVPTNKRNAEKLKKLGVAHST